MALSRGQDSKCFIVSNSMFFKLGHESPTLTHCGSMPGWPWLYRIISLLVSAWTITKLLRNRHVVNGLKSSVMCQVPVFRSLPRSELPKVAAAMVRSEASEYRLKAAVSFDGWLKFASSSETNSSGSHEDIIVNTYGNRGCISSLEIRFRTPLLMPISAKILRGNANISLKIGDGSWHGHT